MKFILKFKNSINFFFIFFILAFICSLLNNFYQINFFDNYKKNEILIERHSLINGDIKDFYDEANEIVSDLRSGKNYFETGGEYRRPYLPSRIFVIFSLITNTELYDENNKISKELNKIYFFIFQSIIYYLLLYFLYKKILLYLPKLNSQIVILFLAFEPTLFMYHSSFWSESIFFCFKYFLLFFF